VTDLLPSDPRRAIFDAVRAAARPGLFEDPGHIHALDNLLDAFGVGRAPKGHRRCNAEGIALIERFEGCSLKAYRCPAGVLTIGFGHTGPDVTAALEITAARADELLRDDLTRFEHAVQQLASVASDNQFAALVSFAFNLGQENLRASTLLRKHNAGDFAGAAGEFARWNKAGGRVLAGLTARRAAEAALYAKRGA
jgi:lysozyme